ncbi:hypothetical protein BaRGS_00024798 [Batillaria attramentaria]|uniref:Uncharacterized protein n=1 Tax=Batillaria attramentaria TaxID=370345 RepID=A0ABD0KA21_9CAEN
MRRVTFLVNCDVRMMGNKNKDYSPQLNPPSPHEACANSQSKVVPAFSSGPTETYRMPVTPRFFAQKSSNECKLCLVSVSALCKWKSDWMSLVDHTDKLNCVFGAPYGDARQKSTCSQHTSAPSLPVPCRHVSTPLSSSIRLFCTASYSLLFRSGLPLDLQS